MQRVIDERPLADVDVTPERAREFLWEMVLARTFDERAVALQRRGWMSGYPPFRGQEASQVGAAGALAADDWLFPTYRANAMQLARNRRAADILRFRRGHSEFGPRADRDTGESDADRDTGGSGAGAPTDEDVGAGRTFTQATPIATHLPHAVGAAMAADYRGADHAVCAYFGDGATSEGDFHEALNSAGVFGAPVLFLCENNHWAISMPADRQTASDTIAEKATAYGFEGVRVDGNDPLAVYETVTAARESALAGDPVLVESLTYRQGAHSTSDDPDRYRGDPDLPDWRTADPVQRYAAYLRAEGVVDEGFVPAAREAADDTIDEAVDAVEATADPDPVDLFAHVFETLPPRLRDQRRHVEGARRMRPE